MPEMDDLQREALTLRADRDSLILATSDGGDPDASYAPFVLDDDLAACIFVSELARHTRNLLRQRRAGVLFIEEENEARNPFARRRLALHCRVDEIARDSQQGERLLDRMQQRFGNTVELLRGLPDFHLLRLDVIDGSYVRGFAQAYPVRGNELEIGAQREG